MFRNLTLVAAGFAAATFTSAASADIIDFLADTNNAEAGIGNFAGTIQYDWLGLDMGLVTVELTNTSPTANGGFITGFLFNIDSADTGVASLATTSHAGFLDAAGNTASPFGGNLPYDAGAALGGHWLDGGNPMDGIGVGDTGVFTFDLTADDAEVLSAINFLDGAYDYNFVVRFRGFLDGNSDKTPGMIPAPASLALLGIAGLASTRRRRR